MRFCSPNFSYVRLRNLNEKLTCPQASSVFIIMEVQVPERLDDTQNTLVHITDMLA